MDFTLHKTDEGTWRGTKRRRMRRSGRVALAARREDRSVEHGAMNGAVLGQESVCKIVDRLHVVQIHVNGRHVGIAGSSAQARGGLLRVRPASDDDGALQLRQPLRDAEAEPCVGARHEHDSVGVGGLRENARGC